MRIAALLVVLTVAMPPMAHADWAKPQTRDAVVKRMAEWDAVPQTEWPQSAAPTIIALLTPMLGGFPSRMEGRPSINLDVRKLTEDSLMIARVRMRGFLDDSVNGEEFTALIDSTYDGWTIIGLWRRHECARGWNEGRWVTTPCS